MSAEPAPDTADRRDEDPLVTVPAAQTRLGCSRSWLYERLLAGDIRGIRLGRGWRIRESVVAEIARNGLPAQPAQPTA